MVNLFWTRISAPKTEPKNVWQEITEIEVSNLDEFNELFSKQEPSKYSASFYQLSSSVFQTKATLLRILSKERSNAVGVLENKLSMLGFDIPAIRNALLNWDFTKVGLEYVEQLNKQKGLQEEMELIKKALNGHNLSQLDKPERFLFELTRIPFFVERIECVIIQTKVIEKIKEIESKCRTMQKLCSFLMNDNHLKNLLSVILTLGNKLNAGNAHRGDADGFGLDILCKLDDIKSRDKKISLLQFIVQTYILNHREQSMVYPIPHTDDLTLARSVDFNAMMEEMKGIQTQLSGILSGFTSLFSCHVIIYFFNRI